MKKALSILLSFIMLLSVASAVNPFMPTNILAEDYKVVPSDCVIIRNFQPGLYGGIIFNSVNDIVKLYVKAYNYTKSLSTKRYKDNVLIDTYKLLGRENLEYDVKLDGKDNATLNKLIPEILSTLYSSSIYGLCPSYNISPSKDKNSKYDFKKSMLNSSDVLAANVCDNGDGTITLTIQPKGCELSVCGEDPQGRFFNVPKDIWADLEAISLLSFSSGSLKNNTKIIYKGGIGVIKLDTKTHEIVSADYRLEYNISLNHVNIAVFKDKNVSANIIQTSHYPATEKYLKEAYGITNNMKKTVATPKLTKIISGKKRFTVNWKKTKSVTGYQVQYSTNKKFKKRKFTKKKIVNGSKKTKLTVKKLKSKKKYYVRIRAYKTINGKKVYSSWSAKKTVKTK